MESLNLEHKRTQNESKKAASVVLSVLLCTFTAVCVLLSALVMLLSFSKTPENTLQVFGFKIYCAENDIEQINVKAGSLVVVKNTDTDEYYTHESLSQNIVLSIDKLGYAIQHNALWMTLCFTVPLMLFFLLIIMSESKKIAIKREENKALLELETQVNNLSGTDQDEVDITV